MYLVTKRIEFCYGHRLLDYDGVCKHPHGHNAIAEIDVRTDQLDKRNMVADFSDIKRLVKGWIDQELDKTRDLGFEVVSVRVWETPSSFAQFSRE